MTKEELDVLEASYMAAKEDRYSVDPNSPEFPQVLEAFQILKRELFEARQSWRMAEELAGRRVGIVKIENEV